MVAARASVAEALPDDGWDRFPREYHLGFANLFCWREIPKT
jgi:hypothetical protein